jgi:hypothetical protein
MNDDRSVERAARSFIEPGPTRAPDAAVERALRMIQTTPQERDLRIPRREITMNGLTRFFALGATAAAVVIGAIVVGPRLSGSTTGAPTPTVSPSATSTAPVPSLRADQAFEDYRTARNLICSNGTFEMQKADLTGLYDETISPERRAAVNAGAQQVADAVTAVADELEALRPPPDLAEAHLADVTHEQDLAAIFRKAATLLKEGKIREATAMEHALEAVGELRHPFEVTNRLTPCP